MGGCAVQARESVVDPYGNEGAVVGAAGVSSDAALPWLDKVSASSPSIDSQNGRVSSGSIPDCVKYRRHPLRDGDSVFRTYCLDGPASESAATG